jgi:hypothetical protein
MAKPVKRGGDRLHERWQFRPRQRECHPRRAPGFFYVNLLNPGVGIRAYHEGHVEHPGQDQVIYELSLSSKEPLIFSSPKRLANPL